MKAKSLSAAAGPAGTSCSKEGTLSTAITSCWALRCWATPRSVSSSGHVIYPLLRPAMEELFEQFKPAFLANASTDSGDRKQFWPISAHDHLLLKSDRARVVKPRDAAHFSVRYCRKAKPDALEARLQQLTDGTTHRLHQ